MVQLDWQGFYVFSQIDQTENWRQDSRKYIFHALLLIAVADAIGDSGREKISAGAEEGTRTPTPLRVHGPEPCASANSATSASKLLSGAGRLEGRYCGIYSYKAWTECQTWPWQL